jgi:hypothetical protein
VQNPLWGRGSGWRATPSLAAAGPLQALAGLLLARYNRLGTERLERKDSLSDGVRTVEDSRRKETSALLIPLYGVYAADPSTGRHIEVLRQLMAGDIRCNWYGEGRFSGSGTSGSSTSEGRVAETRSS